MEGNTRARLQQQLTEVERLIAAGESATRHEMESWYHWTDTVLKRGFGEKSEQLLEFRNVMYGPWPHSYPDAVADGLRERLPQWARLIRTWIREIDEFETPTAVPEQYIPPRSQFDAYVLLKETLEGAASSVTLVDPYTDEATLQPLVSISAGIHVRVLTVYSPKDFERALNLFRQQWGGNIEARKGSKDLHDRFLLVDDKVFFSGASFKDLGQKGSVIAEIRSQTVKDNVRKDIEALWQAAQPIT